MHLLPASCISRLQSYHKHDLLYLCFKPTIYTKHISNEETTITGWFYWLSDWLLMDKDVFIFWTRNGSELMFSWTDWSTQDSKSTMGSVPVFWSLAVSNLSRQTISDLFNFSCTNYTKCRNMLYLRLHPSDI